MLNYLGYTWVDQSQNLQNGDGLHPQGGEAQARRRLLRRQSRLGLYRLGNIPSAVEQLERAVELKPDDPVINDHLGDAYWRIGRTLEAKYQWQQVLSLKPDSDLRGGNRRG